MRLERSRFIAESYFQFHSDNLTNNVGTSKKLFSKHPCKPSVTKLASYLDKQPKTAQDSQISRLKDWIERTLFPQWYLQIMTGFSLGLYGYGSKTDIINRFVKVHFPNWHLFVMPAYEKDSLYIELLLSIASNALGIERPSKRINEATEQITASLEEWTGNIMIVIEMADAPCMRNAEIWKSLAQLSKCSNLRFIYTFEHVNVLLMNNDNIWTCLRICWTSCTTMEPYSTELESLSFSRKGGVDSESRWTGAQFVLKSLTGTARNVYRILAEHQLSQGTKTMNDSDGEEDDETEQRCLSAVSWYQRCQEQFIVSNELAFRTQLTEFVDHELVRSTDGFGQNGNEFYIPFERAQIETLLDICK